MHPLSSLFRLGFICLSLSALCSLAAAQQTYTPAQPDNTLTPGDPIGVPPQPSKAGTHEAVSNINGGLSFFLPVLTLPQRGSWNLTLGYYNTSPNWQMRQDSSTQIINQAGGAPTLTNISYNTNIVLYASGGPLNLNLPSLQASIEYAGSLNDSGPMNPVIVPVVCITNWVLTDWAGNRHPFTNVTECSAIQEPLAQVTDSSDGSWLRLDTSNYHSDIIVRTKDGTTYHFPGWPASGDPFATCNTPSCYGNGAYAPTSGNSYNRSFSSMVDSTGQNTVTYNGSTLTDTIGRTISFANGGITYEDASGNSQTIQVTQSKQTAQAYNFSFVCSQGKFVPNLTVAENYGPKSFNESPSTYIVTLPAVNGVSRVYTLQFDGLGNLQQISYPSGGYTKYDYQDFSFFYPANVQSCSHIQHEVAHKRECLLSSGACSSSQELVTTYTPTPDGVSPFNDNMAIQDPLGNVTDVVIQNLAGYPFVTPHETARHVYPPGLYPSGTPLRNIQTTYTSYNPGGGVDVELPASITTTLNDVTPPLSGVTNYQYETVTMAMHCFSECVSFNPTVGINNPTEIDEYDYVSTGAGPALKKTGQMWMTTSNGSLYDIAGGHLLDRLASRTITDPASNAQSTLSYGYNSIGDVTSKNVGGTGVTTLTTSYQRDGFGNITQMTDPKSNVTTFGYSDNWANTVCAPSSSSSAYLTSITDALNHVTNYAYNSCTGSKASSTDPNGAKTSQSYDSLGRPTQTHFPDGGQTTNTYVDSSPNSVTTSTLVTSGLSRVSKTILDGFGRTSQTQLTSDPDGVTYVDTTYDAVGRVYCVSNPYRSTSDASYGITTHVYDALDRTTAVQPPDYWANSSASSPTCQSVTPSTNPANPSNYVATSYSGNTTTVTDQAGKLRKSVTDALGRLTQVFEDPAGLNYETDYGYDAFANLRTVNQKGGSTSSANWRTRTFAYNALSELTSATNPESGTVSYGYDNDGNLISKTSPAPNQDGLPATGSATVSGSEQSQAGAPATAGTGSVTFSGTLESKQVQTQPATAGTGSATVSGSEKSITNPATQATGRLTIFYTTQRTQSVTVGSYTCNFNYPMNTQGTTVSGPVASCLNNSGLVTASASSNMVLLTSIVAGTAGNYSLSWSGFNGSISGMSGGQDGSTTYDTGSAWVYVNGTQYSTSYGQNDTSSTVATGIANAISAGSWANASASGSTISITAKTTGASTNYSLSAGSSTNNSGLFGSPSFNMSVSGSALTGGQDAVYNTIYDHGSSTITVNNHPDTFPWSGSGTTSSSIALGLQNVINADSGAFVTALASGSTVSLTAKTTGANTNYSLASSSTYDSTDFSSPSFTSSNSGSTLVGGQDASSTIYDSGSVWVTLNGTQYPASYGQGSSSSALASALASAISAGSLANAVASGSSISITAKSNGSGTNYTLSSGSSTSQPGTFPSPSFSVSVSGASLTGGTDPGGMTVTASFSYDALNRLTQKSFSDGSTPTVKYGYDGTALSGCAVAPPALTDAYPIYRRTAMCDSAGAESWSHDSTGRVLTDSRTTNGVTKSTIYAYAPYLDGSINTITYPGSRVITYTLKSSGANTASRLLSAVDTANSINYATAASYAPTGGLSSFTNGASLISTHYYNSRLQPCRISVKSSGKIASNCADSKNIGNVLDLTFGFNLGSGDNGNVAFITNKKDNTRSQNFTYDSLNRLATAQTQTSGVTIPNSNCWGLTFGYDPWGNLLSSTMSGPSGCGEPLPFSLYATNNNQLSTSPTQLTGYCYDGAGNLVLNSTCPVGSFTPTYSYDAENQMTSTAGFTYTYDGDGKRVMKSSGTSGTLYWYGMSSDSLDETDLAGNTNNSSFFEYVFFNGQRIARRDYQNNVNYYFSDHLGTSRVVTNSSGTILDDSDFYPFGGERVVSSSSGNHYKFTSKERDFESGLDNFGARYNSSSFGRFMSADSKQIGAHMLDPQTLNRYVYTRNNPLAFVDPDGRDLEKAWEDVKTFAKSVYAKASIGVGYEAKLKAGKSELKAGAAYKVSIEGSANESKISRSVEAGVSASVGSAKGGESIAVEQTVVRTDGKETTVAEKPEVKVTDTIGGHSTSANSSSDQIGLGVEAPLGPEPIVGGVEVGTTREGLAALKDAAKEVKDSVKNPGPPPPPPPPKPPNP